MRDDALIAKRADTIGGARGDEYYAQFVWFEYEDEDDGTIYDNTFAPGSPIKWERMKRGFKQIFKDFPKDIKSRVAFIKFALKAGDEDSIKWAFDDFRQ